jgi:hypothetical protein
MQTIVLHNFAGAGCNLIKYLTWTLLFDQNPAIQIMFYYRNKKALNDCWKTIFLETFEDMIQNNLFYKLFEYPSGQSEASFHEGVPIVLSFPSNIPIDMLPPCMQNYPIMFPTNIHGATMDVNFTSFRKFYSDPLLPEIRLAYFNQIRKNMQFRPWLQEEIQKELQLIQDIQKQGKTVLAVFLRFTNHYKGEPYKVQAILDEINTYAKNYDHILVTTQVQPAFDLFQQYFGSKVIAFSRKRLPGDEDWKKDVSDSEFEDEVKMAIIDSYLMSQCNFVLSGMSNMLLLSLFFNPHIPFALYDLIKAEVTG